MANLIPYRDINVKISADSYVFSSPSSRDALALVVERPSGDLRLSDASTLPSKRVTRVSPIHGILGLIQLKLDKYAIIITKARPVGRMTGHMIYKIVSTDLLPLRERQVHDPDEDGFLLMLRNFLNAQPMYFAYSLDLTNSFQRQSQSTVTHPLWQRADHRFFWNHSLQSDLIALRNNGTKTQPGTRPEVDSFILPVISGMLEIKPTQFKTTQLTFALVSRRSRYRAGTRYFNRGLDDEGNAANYNETEQIIILNDTSNSGPTGYVGTSDMQSGKFGAGSGGPEAQILSYVQTRGSVPSYWAEINCLHYIPKLQLRSAESAVEAAQEHFDEQIRIYGDVYLINLVKSKGREQRIKESYEGIVTTLVPGATEQTTASSRSDEKFHTIQSSKIHQKYDRLHYVYFDFHNEIKGLQTHRSYAIIDKLVPVLQSQGYFRAVDTHIQMGGQLELRSYQTSVMRTNCMDCLDRTNVIQSMFGRHMLDRMFEDLGLMTRGSSFRTEDPAFENMFRNIWADNADVVANSYAGTGAMGTDLTRTGKHTILGRLQDGRIGLSRYIRNNFLDGRRQDAFDLFLGIYRPGEAIGTGRVLTDQRPTSIQAIPYLLAFSFFIILVSLFTTRVPDSAVLPRRVFILLWTLVAAWCLRFIWTHAMLYVQWPKLAPRAFASEAYERDYSKASKDLVIGSFIGRHSRDLSTSKYIGAEEGLKKRIE